VLTGNAAIQIFCILYTVLAGHTTDISVVTFLLYFALISVTLFAN